jgi:hypothetical protein
MNHQNTEEPELIEISKVFGSPERFALQVDVSFYPDWPEPTARIVPIFESIPHEPKDWNDLSDVVDSYAPAVEFSSKREARGLWRCEAFEAFITIWGLARGDSQDDDYNHLGWDPSTRQYHFDTSFGSTECFIAGTISGLLSFAVLLMTNGSEARLVYHDIDKDGRGHVRDCYTSAAEAEGALLSAYWYLRGVLEYSQATATERMKAADAARKFSIGHLGNH